MSFPRAAVTLAIGLASLARIRDGSSSTAASISTLWNTLRVAEESFYSMRPGGGVVILSTQRAGGFVGSYLGIHARLAAP